MLLKGGALNVALEHGLALECQALIKSKVEGMIHTCLFTAESPHKLDHNRDLLTPKPISPSKPRSLQRLKEATLIAWTPDTPPPTPSIVVSALTMCSPEP